MGKAIWFIIIFMDCVSLCISTAYDISNSTVLPDELARRAKDLGYSALGIADTTMRAYPAFTIACEKYAIRPIYGLLVKLKSAYSPYFKGYFYIESETGYRNLLKIIKKRKEIYSIEDFKTEIEGLSLVIQTDDNFQDEYYLSLISKEIYLYRSLFQDHFALGITLVKSTDLKEVDILYKFCQDNNYTSLAFPSVRYLYKGGDRYLEMFNCFREKREFRDEMYSGPEFLLGLQALNKIYRECDIKNAFEFSKRFAFEFVQKRGSLIHFDDEDRRLEALCFKALKEKNLDAIEDYIKRLQYELSVIKDMRFSSYFLIVNDYVSFAKNAGIVIGPGRGSACGSLVSYLLGITQLDPLVYNLSFERFLNPKRATMPDIDIDFEDQRRDEVQDYIERRYGVRRVSQIRTYSTLKPRSALECAGKALNVSGERIKYLAYLCSKKAETFKEALDDPIFGWRLKRALQDPYYARIFNEASKLYGLIVSVNVHAPGLIINDSDISLAVPREEKDYGPVEFEYKYMEEMGFLKVDILPLSNLTFIKNIEKRIKAAGKDILDIQKHLDDEKSFEILNSLLLTGIFQLDAASGIKEAIKKIKPQTFSDIAALLALYRPGPIQYIDQYAERKNDKATLSYYTPLLEEVLKETYGIMIYQEQVMEVAIKAASFTASDADLFRRAISKKKANSIEMYKKKFLDGCRHNGISSEVSKRLFLDVEKFAGYGFNKSHAYAYALLTYKLLYYKANYPEEFYKEAFSNCTFQSKTSASLLLELESQGYRIKTPDINKSSDLEFVFTVDGSIYPPLAVVKGMNKQVVTNIVEERKKGEFKNLYDFYLRLNSLLSKNDLLASKNLISAGAFDCFSKSRESMLSCVDDYCSFADLYFENNRVYLPKDKNDDLALRLLNEKNSLGFILSTKLSSLCSYKDYETFIVKDVSAFADNNITIINEMNEYNLTWNRGLKFDKQSFIAVKGLKYAKRECTCEDVVIIKKEKCDE